MDQVAGGVIVSPEEATRLLEGTTPGPWAVDLSGWNQHRPASAKVKVAEPKGRWLAQSAESNDARLMAAAPDLAAEVVRLSARVEQLEAAYRRGDIRGYCDADNGARNEFEWTEAEWRAAYDEAAALSDEETPA